MRIPGFPLVVKATAFILDTYHSIDMKTIEAWAMTAYINVWPIIIRLFT